MAKQKEVTPPEITEELLREAEQRFCESKEGDVLRAAIFREGETKRRFHAVGKALLKLRAAWQELSAEEREWFFMSVNAPKEATKLLLGQPDDDPYYDMKKQPHEVQQKLDAACHGYMEYKEVAGYSGNSYDFRHKALVEFLMEHWENVTGTPATYRRNHSRGSKNAEPIGVAKWVQDCMQRLHERGVKGVEPANAESRVENVYKRMRKRRLASKKV